MPMSSARGRKKKFKWAPMLKSQVDLAAVSPQALTAESADAALGVMKVQQGRPVRTAVPPKKQASATPAATRRAVRASPRSAGMSPARGRLLIAALAIAGLGTCGWLVGSLLQGHDHHVGGTVMVGQRPLAEAMLCFHAGSSTVPCMSTITGQDGRFAVDIPAGAYKITVRSVGDSDQGIPSMYGQVESTRFSLSVDRDVAAATMYIESK